MTEALQPIPKDTNIIATAAGEWGRERDIITTANKLLLFIIILKKEFPVRQT